MQLVQKGIKMKEKMKINKKSSGDILPYQFQPMRDPGNTGDSDRRETVEGGSS